jgi:predicted negative regulator of RcsB-dependent stress response
MKSQRRHELSTNELADWMANIPEWWEKNGRIVVYSAAVIVVAVAVWYFTMARAAAAQTQEAQKLNEMLYTLENFKYQMAKTPESRGELSNQTILLAAQLKGFADSAANPNAAAFALIKSAEAIRTASHYNPGAVDPDAEARDMNSARESCLKAIEKIKDNSSLMASARIQLGLCQESLGQFDEARKTYKGIVDSAQFKGDAAVAQAQLRLAVMDEFAAPVLLAPAPVAPAAIAPAAAPRTPAIPPTIARPVERPKAPAVVTAGPNEPAPAK